MPNSVYLDYNATAPVRSQAVDAVLRTLKTCGNPSSVHGPGRTARRVLEGAREAVAVFAGAQSGGVIFTSGGTEANGLALNGRRVLASAVEHPSVLKWAASQAPVTADGVVDLEALARLLEQDKPDAVAVMLANNETGVVQPVAEIAALARRQGAWVHCDAVQAAGKLVLDIEALGVDSLSLSGHKLGGPQGSGALVLADPDADLFPLLLGGGQEKRRRAGTENLPGIAGFAAAADLASGEREDHSRHLAQLRDGLESRLRAQVPELVILGRGAERLPNTSCLALPGVSAQTQVMALDLAGFAVSAGSACSSGKVGPSHVIAAMGRDDLAVSAIRVSLGWASTEEDVDRFADEFIALARRNRAQAVSAA